MMLEVPTPHWHEHNPWKDHIVYVPLVALASCTMGAIDPRSPWTMVDEIAYWIQYGDKLDAYILTGPTLTGGVRFGPNGSHYLSPGFSLPKLHALLKRYRPEPIPREG
jgi:hypothetical protein